MEKYVQLARSEHHDLFIWLREKPLRFAILATMALRARRTNNIYDQLSIKEFYFSETEYEKFGLRSTQKTVLRNIIIEFISRKIIEKNKNKKGRNGASVYRLINEEIFYINADNKEPIKEVKNSNQRYSKELNMTNNNDNNEKNDLSLSATPTVSALNQSFDFKEYLESIEKGQRGGQVIALYWKHKGYKAESREMAGAEFKRWIRLATGLGSYSDEQIKATFKHLDDLKLSWGLNGVANNIGNVVTVAKGAEGEAWPDWYNDKDKLMRRAGYGVRLESGTNRHIYD